MTSPDGQPGDEGDVQSRHEQVVVVGIDLAWGERNPDGLCCVRGGLDGALVETLTLSRGDDELLATIHPRSDLAQVLAIDAPLICRNETGSRPVDREVHRQFGRYQCGCYPVNRKLCQRPFRIAERWREKGFRCDWRIPRTGEGHMVEVYPHTALVRWFDLSERLRYKKGRVVDRRREFARLQSLLEKLLLTERVEVPVAMREPIEASWTKDREDQLDALVCSLIGYHHWKYQGHQSQVLGDEDSGFLVTVASAV